jgi:hypothetical protein
MVDYRTDEPTVERRSGSGRIILVAVIVIAAIVAALFATGFWSADVKKEGALPEVTVKGGELPAVDLDSKEVVVDSKKTNIEVPKVKTETETIDIPTVEVKDNGER